MGNMGNITTLPEGHIAVVMVKVVTAEAQHLFLACLVLTTKGGATWGNRGNVHKVASMLLLSWWQGWQCRPDICCWLA